MTTKVISLTKDEESDLMVLMKADMVLRCRINKLNDDCVFHNKQMELWKETVRLNHKLPDRFRIEMKRTKHIDRSLMERS